MKHIVRLAAACAIAFASTLSLAHAEPQLTATDAVRGVKQVKTVKPQFKKRVVRLVTDEAPGTVIVDTTNKYLYLVEGNNRVSNNSFPTDFRERAGLAQV